ncbi:MAG: hypothetical protein ACW991_08385 [Candidatus Hodarchaeales archaeon]
MKFVDEIVYIGSTCDLKTRKSHHKSQFKTRPDERLYVLLKELSEDYNDFEYKILQRYPILEGEPLEMKKKLEGKELEWIQKENPMFNLRQPALDPDIQRQNKNQRQRENPLYKEYQKEYREENKEKLKEKKREYYQENKETLNEKNKQYVKDNYDKVRAYKTQWARENKTEESKQKAKEKRSEKVECDVCGDEMARGSLKRHKDRFHKIDSS